LGTTREREGAAYEEGMLAATEAKLVLFDSQRRLVIISNTIPEGF